MPDENRIAAKTVGEDGNRQRFHQGNAPHILPADLSEEEEATLAIHRASIRAPESKPRWGYDAEGNPVEVGPQGLLVTDPVTGAVEPLDDQSIERAEQVRVWREDRQERGLTGGVPPDREPRRAPTTEETPESDPGTDPATPPPPPPPPAPQPAPTPTPAPATPPEPPPSGRSRPPAT